MWCFSRYSALQFLKRLLTLWITCRRRYEEDYLISRFFSIPGSIVSHSSHVFQSSRCFCHPSTKISFHKVPFSWQESIETKQLSFRNKIRLTIILTWFWIVFLSTFAELLQPTQQWNFELLKYENSGPAYIDLPWLHLVFPFRDWICWILGIQFSPSK